MGDMADSIEWFVEDFSFSYGPETRTGNPQEDHTTMKNHTLISVLQATKGVRTVKVKFSPNGEIYTYKTILDLEPEQFVVVECRKAYSVAQVVFMDDTPDVLDENVELKWVVQAVDVSKIAEIREEEHRLARQISLSTAKQKLNQVIKDLDIDVDMPAIENRKSEELIDG